MACSIALSLGLSTLLGLAPVGHGMSIQGSGNGNWRRQLEDDGTQPEWIQNVSHVLEVSDYVKIGKVGNDTAIEDMTAIVTFAGKRSVEYIDGAVMLGMSIRKHLPNTPMVALIIQAMTKKMKNLLKNAGWTLVTVPNWDREYCGESCDMEFLGRWHDSFEKINAFRLPFKKVLFLDSDTYVFSPRISELLNETDVPDGHIAMAKDGCKNEYNSGVMVYKPDLNVFMDMLKLVTKSQREQILDQNLINNVYSGKVVEVPREFNCVDTLGTQPGLKEACKHHCSENVVVAHFTGHPKPTAAKRKQLAMVRRPGAPAIACTNTNFGSCMKWSSYYCDIRQHRKKLSKSIQYWLKSTGGCCHTPFDPSLDEESCKECPATLEITTDHAGITGTYVKTTYKSTSFNGGRPIYMRMDSSDPNPLYLFFVQKQMLWILGPDPQTTTAKGYAGIEAQCPRDAKAWTFWDGKAFQRRKMTLKTLPNDMGGRLGAPNDTELIAWNVDAKTWEHEAMPEGFWETEKESEKDDRKNKSDKDDEDHEEEI